MIDRNEIIQQGGSLRWQHETDYGFRYVLTLYTNYNYLEFDVIRMSDHRHVFGTHCEHKRWEDAVARFEKTKADILDPNSGGHAAIQRNAAKYYPETEEEAERDLMSELSRGHASDDMEKEMGFIPFDQEW